jgi:threonine/homoserine/homoserine lactone efflux protein
MLLDLFLIGLVVTVEPIPLTAMILVLAAERGLIKGLGYVFGWLLTLVGIVALTVLVTGGKPLIPQSSPSTAALVVKLLIGVVLVFIALRRRRRPKSTEPKRDPRWMASVDRISPLGAAGLAFLLQPWVLVAAGVSTIVEAKLDTAWQWLALFAFCLLCTASYFALETYAALRPEVVQERLNSLMRWINSHRDQAIVLLSMALGLYLVAKSIYGLVSA